MSRARCKGCQLKEPCLVYRHNIDKAINTLQTNPFQVHSTYIQVLVKDKTTNERLKRSFLHINNYPRRTGRQSLKSDLMLPAHAAEMTCKDNI